jgi:hypothetical protein
MSVMKQKLTACAHSDCRTGSLRTRGQSAHDEASQIWLVSAALETFLAGHTGAVLETAIFSGLVFLGCPALDLFVTQVDQDSRKDGAAKQLEADHAL